MLHRLEQVLDGSEGVDVVKSRIDQDKVTVVLSNPLDVVLLIGAYLGAQQVIARIASHFDPAAFREMRILPP
mgnify:CR=1 FL=1